MDRIMRACLVLGAVLVSGSAAAYEDLYEGINVLGSLKCELDASVLLRAEERHAIRCDFESANVRDNLNRYFVTLGGVDGGSVAGDADVLSWTVIRLGSEDEGSSRGSILGSYGRILPSVAEQYGLDETALVGGSQARFALEPRSEDRSNAAAAISSLEISF
jgi:hypothetical protein